MTLGRNQILGCVLVVATLLAAKTGAQDLEFSKTRDSFRFAIIGDSGTGGSRQREVADQMAALWKRYPFDTVLMLGDNLYGGESPHDFYKKFERPYAKLLSSGVKFHASLGNHDEANQRLYPAFNMGGHRYYTVALTPYLRAISLDSTAMDSDQVHWLENELSRKQEQWTIVFMHHPLYSSGKRHGPSVKLREALEPLFMKYGVNVVFSGHEHFYERLNPQNGIQYFISGAAGKLRRSNIRRPEDTGCGFDQDNSFMLFQASESALQFATVSREGNLVDQGTISKKGQENFVSAACMVAY
jgi:Calcineurin-like phosphoesterase